MPDESKVCKSCFKEKVLTDFYFRKESGGYKNVCKRCQIDGKTLKVSDTKLCKHCAIPKPKSDFQKASGKWLQPYCKPCDAERKRKYTEKNIEKVIKKRKDYYSANKVAISEKTQKRYISKKDQIRAQAKEYRDRNVVQKRQKDKEYCRLNREKISKQLKEKRALNPEYYKAKARSVRQNRTPEQKKRLADWQKEYRAKNRDRILAHKETRRHIIREQNRIRGNKKAATDIHFRIVKNLRSRTRFALKKWNTVKSDTTEKLLGCTIPQFKEYFSSLFTDDMTWDAFMRGEIHIDHKTPCVKFDLRIPEEQARCFHHTNLQPLWELDNLKKGVSCG